MDFNFQIFERHAVAEVAIQPIGLFDNGDAAREILPEVPHHLTELLAARGFGRLHVNEFVHNLEFMRAGILAQKLQLSGNGIAFALLVLARNPCINDGWFHVGLRIGNCFAQHALSESWCQSTFRIPRKNFLFLSSATHGPIHPATGTCCEGNESKRHRGLLPLWSPAFLRSKAIQASLLQVPSVPVMTDHRTSRPTS